MCLPHHDAVLSPGGEYLDPHAQARWLPPENPCQRPPDIQSARPLEAPQPTLPEGDE